MKDRGEIKNTLWNPLIDTLIIYFLAWDLFACSSWFKNTWNVSTRLTWLKTNLCWQQNQTDRNRTVVFSCHKNVTKQHIVSCVFALCPSWLNYEILFTKKHYSSLFKRINMIKGLVEKWLKLQLLKCTSACRENKKAPKFFSNPSTRCINYISLHIGLLLRSLVPYDLH